VTARELVELNAIAVGRHADDRDRARFRPASSVASPHATIQDPVYVLPRDAVQLGQLGNTLAALVSCANVIGLESSQDVHRAPDALVGIDHQVPGRYAELARATASYVAPRWDWAVRQLVGDACGQAPLEDREPCPGAASPEPARATSIYTRPELGGEVRVR